jgi:sulfopyruvate decarboxylase TPP-binding subunit
VTVKPSAPGVFALPPTRTTLPLDYAPDSPERRAVDAELRRIGGEAPELPLRIGGRDVLTDERHPVVAPHDTQHVLAHAHWAGPEHVEQAIAAGAEAWQDWSRMAWEDRAAIFLRAAELARGPWRATLNAVAMLDLSKTVREADIDASCETADFLAFHARYMREMYAMQPESTVPGAWNRVEYRPLEGFVYAISPFNFLCLATLAYAPAIMGNVVLWKPAEQAELSAWYGLRLLEEAGLPPGVINLIFGDGPKLGEVALSHPSLAGVNFTGSAETFRRIWRTVGSSISTYRNFPRLVGETGGKDFIVAHPSADLDALATAVVRGAFEFQGQKCSAVSRTYVPESLWPQLRERLEAEIAQLRVGDRAGPLGRQLRGGRRRRDRRQPRLVRAPHGPRDARSLVAAAERRVLRADRLHVRLSRRRLERRARPGRRPEPLRAHRRGLLERPLRRRGGGRRAAPHRRQLLRQRQADRLGRGRAAVRRLAGVGDQRQGHLDLEPQPLGHHAHHQGDAAAAPALALPVGGGVLPGAGHGDRGMSAVSERTWQAELGQALLAEGVEVAAWVPDKRMAPIAEALEAQGLPMRTLTREEECFGYAAGHRAAGGSPLVLIQCSGLGNALNTLGSLVIPYGYGFPLVLSMRGTLGEANPSQIPLGRSTVGILELMGIQSFSLRRPEDIPAIAAGAMRLARDARQVAPIILEPELES